MHARFAMNHLLSFVAVVLVVCVHAIPPHTAPVLSAELPPTTSTDQLPGWLVGRRDVIGDVASVIQAIDGATMPTSTTSAAPTSTTCAAPPITCPPLTPSPSPSQPLFNWWTAFLTSATTFTHPVGVFALWLAGAVSFGFFMWFAYSTFLTLLEIWTVWLKARFSTDEREAHASKMRDTSTQTTQLQERGTQTDVGPGPAKKTGL
ncbi:hypothetical protein K488DRAFT_74372 [Vararia minispora EC-137]|uniref:Uncharacterized protein n=1 Tax=Vararia minispora EC-137 TaxID=1314806 RepID=A0ACB8Q820_9AGAM|nr:hypothetical protein K488DRAFT_74372 [Vararia minispora EC-137]